MSDLQQPMYGGARMNAASSTPAPVQTADVSTKPAQRALQNAQEFVSDVAHQYQRMKDFGEQTRLEGQMDTLATEFEQEMTKRLGFARGHELSFYNGDGTLKESSLNTFVRNYEGKFRGLKGSFVSQEEAAKFGARQQNVMRRVQGRASELLLKGQIQESRQALDAKLKLAEERKDWKGYEDAVMGGLNAGLLAPDQAELMKEKANKINLGQQFDNLAATNPDLAAEMINRGELDGYFSAAEQEQMMRSLRSHDDDRLTELINQAVSQPKGKDNRQAMASALLAGSPYEDELKFLSIYNRDQSFAACMPEIENFLHSLADDVAPGEEKDSLERKMTDLSRKCTFYQMPSDTKSRLLKRMEENAKRRAEYPKLNAVDYIRNATAGRNVKLYDPALYNERIGSLNQAANSNYALVKESYKNAGFSVPDRAKWGEKYAHDSINALEDELTNQTVFKVRVAFDTWHNAYKQDHGDKEPSITLQEDKLETLLRQFTGNQSFSLPGKFGQEADKAVKEADRAAENAYRQRKKSAPKLADDQTKKRLIPQKTFTFPATLSVDTVQTNAPAGILLPESMKKRFGDDLSHVAALVPSSPSSRRGRPLPVVGYTKAASPQLTLSGASKLRMTFSSRMNTHVSIVPAGKEMQEFFKREFLNQADSEAPSPDFGLVPDNGVETAEPVSGAYLNGDLTVLPPLN